MIGDLMGNYDREYNEFLEEVEVCTKLYGEDLCDRHRMEVDLLREFGDSFFELRYKFFTYLYKEDM